MVVLDFRSFRNWKINDASCEQWTLCFMNEQQLIVQWRSNFYYLFCVCVNFLVFSRPSYLHCTRNICYVLYYMTIWSCFGSGKSRIWRFKDLNVHLKPNQQKIEIIKKRCYSESVFFIANWPQYCCFVEEFTMPFFRQILLLVVVSDTT